MIWEARMDIDFVFKIAAIGILTSVVSQVLKRAEREDIATLATLAGLVVVLLMVVNMLSEFFGTVREVFQLY
jgi:stage III sporulation protein AC